MNATSETANAAETNPDVVVVGFGFAGAHAVSTLLAAGRSVVVVEPTGNHQFLTRLAAVAAGTQPLTDRAVRIDAMFDIPVVTDRAVAANEGSVTLESGRIIEAEYVLLTAGAEPIEPPIKGLHHAMPLRSAEHAVAIRRRLDDVDEVVIVGGGPTGCQLAGAIRVAHPDIAVSLVDGGDRLMSNFDPRLGEYTLHVLEQRGVKVTLSDEAASISADGVTLESGRQVSGAVMWTAGFRPTMTGFGPTEAGQLVVDQHARVSGFATVFAAGDAAGHIDASGEPYAMSAQIAAQAGKQVGRNLDALLDGGPIESLDLKDRGWVVDLAGGVGVAEILGIAVARPGFDRVVPFMHDAIDLRNLWQLGGVEFVRRFRPGAIEQGLNASPSEPSGA